MYRAHRRGEHSVNMKIVIEVSNLTTIDLEPEAKDLSRRRLK